jgi:molybdate transport system substrate-binding protein
MDAAARSGVVAGLRSTFANNKLVIIIPKANEANIKTPQDLAKAGVKIVIAGENVPAGRYTRQFLDAASETASFGAGYKEAVLANVVSEAGSVKEVAAAVQLDEVDAGVVYVTDVTDAIADDVAMIDIPEAVNQTATYPISLTYSGFSNAAAQTFIDYVLSETGQDTLASFGFSKADQ